MCSRLTAGGMFCEQSSQADGLVAKLFANQFFATRSFVAFIEEQVQALQDAVEPTREFFAGGDFERNPLFTDFLFGSSQAFGDRGLGGEERAADFSDAEAAKSF